MKSINVKLNYEHEIDNVINLTPYFDSYKVLIFDSPTYVSDAKNNLKKEKICSLVCSFQRII